MSGADVFDSFVKTHLWGFIAFSGGSEFGHVFLLDRHNPK